MVSTSLQDRLNKLHTLQEDLENVSIENITPQHKTIRRSPSAQYSQQHQQISAGLGLTAPPRRPSDNMVRRHTSNPRLTILERPVSNDSITTNVSTFSDFSEDLGDSRNSSMTSGSIRNSPLIKNASFSTQSIEHQNEELIPPRLRHTTSTPKFFPSYVKHRPKSMQTLNLSNNQLPNTSTNSLTSLSITPSQKLRLKRQNSKSSSKSTIVNEREKYYDLNSDDDDTLEDGFIWNVPFTRGAANIFSPSSGTNPHLIKAILNQSPVMLPMSPLPGACSAPISPVTNRSPSLTSQQDYFYSATSSPNEAESISQFYQISSENYVKQELLNRKKSSLSLPSMIKEASNLGLDDLKLVSERKARSLSSTRPIWLPPKPSEESTRHEKDISKMFEKASRLDKLKQEQHDKQMKAQESNIKRWAELVQKGSHRSSAQNEMKKLCLKTKIPDEYRYQIWSAALDKARTSSTEIETFEELNSRSESLPNLPFPKAQELKEITRGAFASLGSFDDQEYLEERLLRLLKLLMYSKISIVTNFDEYLLALLLLKFNEEDSFNLFYSIRVLVFSDALLKKFDTNLYKNSIMVHQLRSNEFKPDLEYLSSMTIMKILSKFRNLDIAFQFLDILVLNINYRVIYCLLLTILKEYHFGFDDLTELIEDKHKHLRINCDDTIQFYDKFNGFYKKFF